MQISKTFIEEWSYHLSYHHWKPFAVKKKICWHWKYVNPLTWKFIWNLTRFYFTNTKQFSFSDNLYVFSFLFWKNFSARMPPTLFVLYCLYLLHYFLITGFLSNFYLCVYILTLHYFYFSCTPSFSSTYSRPYTVYTLYHSSSKKAPSNLKPRSMIAKKVFLTFCYSSY